MPSRPTRYVHVITPGDHYSEQTGSAVPTVVDGLSRFASAGAAGSSVCVASGTYSNRYSSAEVREYRPADSRLLGGRYIDPLLGRLGLPRINARRQWGAAVRDQDRWSTSIVISHNGPQLIPLIDSHRHASVLYAHNELFATYSAREVARNLARVDAIVCVSEFLAERTISRLPSSIASRVRVVRNGVDVEAFHPADLTSPDHPIRVLFVGRAIRAKGPDVVLRAMTMMKHKDVEVTIMGSSGFDPKARLSSYEVELRRLAQELNGRASFVPTVERSSVPDALRTADIIVVPSRWPDPCPLTVGEGLATGVPVIASRIGGIPEIVGDAGLLTPPDDPRALAEAIDALAADNGLRRRLGQAGRARALKHDWTWSRAELDRVLSSIERTP